MLGQLGRECGLAKTTWNARERYALELHYVPTPYSPY